MLVVAYALAGKMDVDLRIDRSATTSRGSRSTSRYLAERREIRDTVRKASSPSSSPRVRQGVRRRRALEEARGAEGPDFAWELRSTYVRNPPFFQNVPREPAPVKDIVGARCLALLGDSVTTDHISPAGSIAKSQPGGAVPHRARSQARGLQLLRRAPRQPRSDDARHLRQYPAQEPAGAGHRRRVHQALPDGTETSIFDAADAVREGGCADW